MSRALALVVLLGGASVHAEDEHRALARGLWVQVTPLELSYVVEGVDPTSVLPWVPLTLGADAGRVAAGIGFGLRPLALGMLLLFSPQVRVQVPTEVPWLGVVFEARLHMGIVFNSGFMGGGGALVGVELFATDWLSFSPGVGADLLGGATGGSRPSGVGGVLSARMGMNFTW